jgi:DNA-directed RNA polymerase subunit RPC12/RpoP
MATISIPHGYIGRKIRHTQGDLFKCVRCSREVPSINTQPRGWLKTLGLDIDTQRIVYLCTQCRRRPL